MKKRPPKDTPLLSPEDPKKVKKSPESSKETFIFNIKKLHTKFILLSNVDPIQDSVLSQENIVIVSLEKEPTEPLKALSVEEAKRFLQEEFLKEEGSKSILEIDMEEEEEKKDAGPKDQKSIRKGQLQLRDQMIYDLYSQGNIKTKCIAQQFGITVNKLQSIKYKIQKQLGEPHERKGPKGFRVTQAMYDELDSFMSQKSNATSTLMVMRNHIAQVFDLKDDQLSEATIYRMLKQIHYTRKRGINSEPQRNKDPSIVKRQLVAQQILSAIKADLKVIFLDETGFTQGLRPLYGYSKVGQPCLIGSEANFQNYSVITAITKEKIIGFQVFKGSIETNEFGAFLAGLVKANPELLKDRSKYVFYMDNAPIHHARSLKPFLKHFNVIYGAPYSPFLNPIEEIFSSWKHIFRRNYAQDMNILPRILESATKISEASVTGYFNHSVSFLKDCLDMKPIL